MSEQVPKIIIVGGGFGGLAAAKALKNTPAQVLLIDRNNHHLFQPLLYQVATSVLTPSQIASPIRHILRRQKNTTVILGEVVGVDASRRVVFVNSADRAEVSIPYDYLIVATGVHHSYFNHNEFEQFAPGLKSIADAVAIRNSILEAFEQAEAEEDPSRHRDLLTFVLVGAGPTGVEMASEIAVLVNHALRSDFRRIDSRSVRIILLEKGNRVLAGFSETLSTVAKQRLADLGVEVRLGCAVDQIDSEGVTVAGERIFSKTVIWTAGTTASPVGTWLNAATDRVGRVHVQQNLSVPGYPEAFVIGDTASLDEDGKPLPGVAQVAIQQGRYAGKLIHRRITGQLPPRPFRYFDKGSMAVVGRGFAVLETGKVQMSGLLACLAWGAVHLQFLAESSLRFSVFLQWVWTYLTGQHSSRLIISHRVSGRDRASASPPSMSLAFHVPERAFSACRSEVTSKF